MSRSVQSPEALLACFLNIYHILLCHALLVARKPSPDSKDKDSKVRQTRPIRVRIITIRVRIITISVRIIRISGQGLEGALDQTRPDGRYTSIPIAISELSAHLHCALLRRLRRGRWRTGRRPWAAPHRCTAPHRRPSSPVERRGSSSQQHTNTKSAPSHCPFAI